MEGASGLLSRIRAIDTNHVDYWVAAALLLAAELQLWLGPTIPERPGSAIACAALSAAVATRRRWPEAAVSVVLAFMVVHMAFSVVGELNHEAGVIVGVLLLFYGLGAFAQERRSMWVLALAVVVTTANALTKQGGGPAAAAVMEGFAVLLPYATGRVVRANGVRERISRTTAEQLDAARDAEAQRAAQTERVRIARELHDVIAHSVSVMVLQAGGARMVMESSLDRSEQSLRNAERAGRDALIELRRLLGLLGSRDVAVQPPQPGLADLAPLVERARASGVSVALNVEGAPLPVTPALDLCAYRILQEALTNVIKHAAPAQASVLVRWQADSLELEVSNDGRRGAGNGHGHGIVGMRERVALLEGTFEAGPGPAGRFAVRARFPLGEAAPL